ncbi:MAG TPA: hypothetical protein VFS61_05295 [Anaerolineales bacterium]|nr:hypothetical protein [Anaerolineales bacterium]
MFKVRWALLCTDVEFNEDGSGDLLSVTEEFHSPVVPFSMGQIAVVMGLQILRSGTGYLAVRLRVSKTRHIVFQSDPGDNFISVQADKEPLNWIYPIYIHNISLPAFGEYTFDILKDSRTVYRHSFHLRQDEEFETRR